MKQTRVPIVMEIYFEWRTSTLVRISKQQVWYIRCKVKEKVNWEGRKEVLLNCLVRTVSEKMTFMHN